MKKMHENSKLVTWKSDAGSSVQNVILIKVKVWPFGHFSGTRQVALYFEWLNFACFANHNTCYRGDQMVGL